MVNKEVAKNLVKKHLKNGERFGTEFRLALDNGSDFGDVAVFKLDYIFGMLHIMAGIEEYGMVEIEDMDGWDWEHIDRCIDEFVDRYFESVDLLQECDQYMIDEED